MRYGGTSPMLDFSTISSAALSLPVEDRVRLIAAVQASLPQGDSAEIAAKREAFIYAEAYRDIAEHREEIERALMRRGGVTTDELLRKAAEAAQRAAKQ
jgi:hypothetical protein